MEPRTDYKTLITIEPGKRGGKPCIRGMRITVAEVLEYLASGMTIEEVLDDFGADVPRELPTYKVLVALFPSINPTTGQGKCGYFTVG